MNKFNVESYPIYDRHSRVEKEAIQALFHGAPEEALGRIQRRQLPLGLTRSVLRAYEAIARDNVRTGEKAKRLVVNGRIVGVMAFRLELIQMALPLCAT